MRLLRLSSKLQSVPIGDSGDLSKAANYRKILILLVAGVGFEPTTFGL
jgi:hypothetical protein